jgi:DNA helicase-2/ATP-dependent DNA helicase PcrA
MTLIDERSLFDYKQMILSAVGYLEGDPHEDDDFGRVQDHIRSDIATSSSKSTRTSTHSRSVSCGRLVRFGANLCAVGDDDQNQLPRQRSHPHHCSNAKLATG